MKFPILLEEKRISRLTPPYPDKKVRIVIDTDTFNEIDDQFAITHALLSPERLSVEAIYAAPFKNSLSSSPKDGMEKSYNEIQKILKILKMTNVPTYKGSEDFLSKDLKPIKSNAVLDLIDRALKTADDDPLYVVAIGAITNVVSAILLEPKIIEKIVVVWLGGHAIHWPNTKEFNLYQDLYASRLILDCGVPLILLPCKGVVSHLSTTLSELKDHIKECGEIGQYLFNIFKNYPGISKSLHNLSYNNIQYKMSNPHFAYSKPLWDIAATAYLINHEWLPSNLIHSPIISDDFRWIFDNSRHFIRYVFDLDRNKILQDLFIKLKNYNNQV